MKMSCSTTLAHRSPLNECLDRIASLGFAEVDLLMAHGWAHASPRDLVDDFAGTTESIRRSLADRGLGIAALNLAFSGPLYGRSDEDRTRRTEEALAVLAFMHEFDVDVAAVQPGGRPHGIADNELIARATESWDELQATAASEGCTFALELHSGSPFDSPDTARELVDRVPATRFAFDPSHLVGQGIDLHQVGWIIAQSAHVHLRDATSGQVQLPMGSGSVDFGWILDQLRTRGYDGYVAVEYLDTDDFDVLASARELASLIEPYVQS